jgi:hypothetical protein
VARKKSPAGPPAVPTAPVAPPSRQPAAAAPGTSKKVRMPMSMKSPAPLRPPAHVRKAGRAKPGGGTG